MSLDSVGLFLPSDLVAVLHQSPAFISVYALDTTLLWTNHVGYGFENGDRPLIGLKMRELFPDGNFSQWDVAFARAVLGFAASYFLEVTVPMNPPQRIRFFGRMGPLTIRGERFVTLAAWDVTIEQPKEPHPLLATYLSADSKIMVAYVLDRGPVRSPPIIRHMGQAASKVRTLLRNLVDRGILTHSDNGYEVSSVIRPFISGVLPLTKTTDVIL